MAAQQAVEAREGEELLRCTVEAIKPKWNFGLRFQAGYRLFIPLVQYSASGHFWKIIVEVAPEGEGTPVYFSDRVELPRILRPEFTGQTNGAFLVGEGRYYVRLAVADDRNRVCRDTWRFDAVWTGDRRGVKQSLAPHAVSDLSRTGATEIATRRTNLRLTFLVNASKPYIPRFVADPIQRGVSFNRYLLPDWLKVPEVDYRMELAGMVSALAERLPGASIRLVMFDLDTRTEIFRRDGFALKDMSAVEHAINDLNRWTVDVRALQNLPDRWSFLKELVRREIDGPERPDAVVFLGSRNGNPEKAPPGFAAGRTGGRPRFLYVQYNPYREHVYAGVPPEMTAARPDRGAAWWGTERTAIGQPLPDTIDLCMRELKGKTFRLFTPADFARAVEAIRKQEALPRTRG